MRLRAVADAVSVRFVALAMLTISMVVLWFLALSAWGSRPGGLPGVGGGTLALGVAGVLGGSLFLAYIGWRPVRRVRREQRNFAAGASREVAEPLADICTQMEQVLEHPSASVESQAVQLRQILAEQRRLTGLVQDLLLLTEAEPELRPSEEAIAVDRLVEQALSRVDSLAAGRNISLNMTVDRGVSVMGDRDLLLRLFSILLDNALRYSGDTDNVEVMLHRAGGRLILTVADTGIGMEREQLDRIFDRFYRLGEARALNPEGSGLGLALAKWIVDLHRGEIHVESAPGAGSTFLVSLPLQRGGTGYSL